MIQGKVCHVAWGVRALCVSALVVGWWPVASAAQDAGADPPAAARPTAAQANANGPAEGAADDASAPAEPGSVPKERPLDLTSPRATMRT
ncbi:MAG: hypothetical protein ACE5E6_12755, partial [Phycisphaerae bacterium]